MQRTPLSFFWSEFIHIVFFFLDTHLNCTLLAGHPPVTLWCSIPKGIVISPNSTAFCTHSFDQYSSYMYSSMSSTLHVSVEFLFILPWLSIMVLTQLFIYSSATRGSNSVLGDQLHPFDSSRDGPIPLLATNGRLPNTLAISMILYHWSVTEVSQRQGLWGPTDE